MNTRWRISWISVTGQCVTFRLFPLLIADLPFFPLQLFDTEGNRKIKREPAMASALELSSAKVVSGSVFGVSQSDAGEEGQAQRDAVNELWGFS